jgi:hypothetical protein
MLQISTILQNWVAEKESVVLVVRVGWGVHVVRVEWELVETM